MEKLKPINHSARSVAELIDKTHWANDFSWDDILIMGRYFTAYEAQRGQVIFYEGAKADYMGLIVTGAIRISKTGSDNQVRPLVVLRESQTFGELSLIDGAPRSGLAEAMTTTQFVITTKRQLMQMSDEDSNLAFRILWLISETISKRLRHTSLKLLDIPGETRSQ
ncbi:Crp/Fnr family transcriptional regulator [Reinekea blandensis]|uniref:Cyclic nucleotide-binding (CNMP-BD) protein n=1 Tax=Reinekea blandensis MED297 TaxID=314283 RepID=A4B9S7_9GAMM|nr:cyclic nucleotide-binding domain-containing protein [Reinekea blandensis]EAR11378.1 Cyclic nucleotide-binding (cNMP-BD) protein [Reinekea sp. MED297] [Reinekea blandensis MED297]